MTEPNEDRHQFYSIKETANKLSLSSRTVWRHIADGTLPHTYLGKRVLIPAEALERLRRDAFGEDDE